MKFFINHKLIPIILVPYRLIKIYVYKLYTLKIKLEADSNIIIVDKGINKIKWEVKNAYLVKLSNKGIVNTKGEYIIKNSELGGTIKLTAVGYIRKVRVITFKKLVLNAEEQTPIKLIDTEPELLKPNAGLHFKTPIIIPKRTAYNSKNIQLHFDLTDIKNEIQTLIK